jgi:hypothetical protein
MSKDVRLLVLSTVGAGLYGYGVSKIPSPREVTVFWVGNFAGPWLALAFLAGWAQRRSWVWSVVAGAAADLTCVVGFYLPYRVLFDRLALGLPDSTPIATVMTTGARLWLGAVAHWLVIAVLAGAVYGWLGLRWGRSRAVAAGVAAGLPFIVEPLLWPLYLGRYQGPLILWIVEVVVGAALVTWVFAVRHRGLAPDGPALDDPVGQTIESRD